MSSSCSQHVGRHAQTPAVTRADRRGPMVDAHDHANVVPTVAVLERHGVVFLEIARLTATAYAPRHFVWNRVIATGHIGFTYFRRFTGLSRSSSDRSVEIDHDNACVIVS